MNTFRVFTKKLTNAVSIFTLWWISTQSFLRKTESLLMLQNMSFTMQYKCRLLVKTYLISATSDFP